MSNKEFYLRASIVQFAMLLLVSGIAIFSSNFELIISYLCGIVISHISFLLVYYSMNYIYEKIYYKAGAKKFAIFSYFIRFALYAILIYISFKLFTVNNWNVFFFIIGIGSLDGYIYLVNIFKGGD